MNYKIIFTDGYTDDIESLTRGLRCDILILTESGLYFNPRFLTLERIKIEFGKSMNCYLEDNLVILHSITKDIILKSIVELHTLLFFKRWIPLSTEQLEQYFYPQDTWVLFDVIIDDMISPTLK